LFAETLTRTFETLGIRGAPTLLRQMSRAFGDKLATVTLPSGERITFPAFDPYWSRYLYAGVPYEQDVEALFRHFGKGRVLIDCGANIGYWSVRHKEFFTGAIAIEANPKLLPILRLNTPDVIHAAVHSKSGETVMLGGDGAGARIIGTGSEMAKKVFRLSPFGKVRQVDYAEPETGVPVKTLALNDLDCGPCLVKLDVEGCEIPAIEGADKLDAIFVLEDFPSRGGEVTRYLLSRGFGLFGYSDRIVPITGVADAGAIQHYGPLGPTHIAATRSGR